MTTRTAPSPLKPWERANGAPLTTINSPVTPNATSTFTSTQPSTQNSRIGTGNDGGAPAIPPRPNTAYANRGKQGRDSQHCQHYNLEITYLIDQRYIPRNLIQIPLYIKVPVITVAIVVVTVLVTVLVTALVTVLVTALITVQATVLVTARAMARATVQATARATLQHIPHHIQVVTQAATHLIIATEVTLLPTAATAMAAMAAHTVHTEHTVRPTIDMATMAGPWFPKNYL